MSTLHGSVASHTSVGLATSSESGDLPSAISTSDKKQEHSEPISDSPVSRNISPEDVLKLKQITNSNIKYLSMIISMYLNSLILNFLHLGYYSTSVTIKKYFYYIKKKIR